MGTTITFDQVLDAVERLPDEQQADLVDVVRHRLALRGRERLWADVKEAREYHAQGNTRPAGVGEIMRDIGL